MRNKTAKRLRKFAKSKAHVQHEKFDTRRVQNSMTGEVKELIRHNAMTATAIYKRLKADWKATHKVSHLTFFEQYG